MTDKYAHEKAARREKTRITPYDLPLPVYCHCGGALHRVDRLRGKPIFDRNGHYTTATICEECHEVRIIERRGYSMASTKSRDAKKQMASLVTEIKKTGVLVNTDGSQTRLTVDIEGKHWKIRTEQGAFIYSLSTTPSDVRAIRNTESQLRNMGVRWGDAVPKNGNGTKKRSSRGAGADLDNLTPIQQRAIAVRARLARLHADLGTPAPTLRDLVKIGMEAAVKRNVWRYSTLDSASVQISRFLNGQTFGDNRSLDFYDALCDELQGVAPENFTRTVGAAPSPPPAAPAPAPPAPAPPPVKRPSDDPPPERQQFAKIIVDLEEAEKRIAVYEKEIASLEEDVRVQAKRLTDQQRDRQVAEQVLLERIDTLEEKAETYRKETLSAQAQTRSLQTELEKARSHTGATTAHPDDPLYLRALRRLVTASSTEDEIREAFEMAMQIFKGDQ